MTNPDYRALCANLTAALLDWQYRTNDDGYADLINHARAALAEPEAEGPTDEELETFLVDVACQNGDMYYADPRVLARAVLARWGRPAAAPVPVSERLPGPEDCDAEGRCWWWDGEWGLVESRFADFLVTHWLPANALPLPAEVKS